MAEEERAEPLGGADAGMTALLRQRGAYGARRGACGGSCEGEMVTFCGARGARGSVGEWGLRLQNKCLAMPRKRIRPPSRHT